MRWSIFSFAGLVFSLVFASGCWAAPDANVPTYLALGDSLAYGMQIGHLKQEMQSGAVDATSFDTGYVNLLAERLKRKTPDLRIVDLGCPGETTESFISGPCAFATNGKPFGTKPLPLHIPYVNAQLITALKYLKSTDSNVNLITIDIGINDLRADELACGTATDFESCLRGKWPRTAKTVTQNMNLILNKLRLAAPHVKILVMTYYNWLGIQHPRSDEQVRDLNQIITESAHTIGATTVSTFSAFNRKQDLCQLSMICGPTKDLHPSDAGYKVIANLFYTKLQ